jgi:hypothetical protein
MATPAQTAQPGCGAFPCEVGWWAARLLGCPAVLLPQRYPTPEGLTHEADASTAAADGSTAKSAGTEIAKNEKHMLYVRVAVHSLPTLPSGCC